MGPAVGSILAEMVMDGKAIEYCGRMRRGARPLDGSGLTGSMATSWETPRNFKIVIMVNRITVKYRINMLLLLLAAAGIVASK